MGNLLLGKGMKDWKSDTMWTPGELTRFMGFVLSSRVIWLGIASLIVFLVAYSLVLSLADYSYVQPASAFAYATAALLGHFVLGETVSPLQWAGIMVISMGVFIVGRTPPRTTERN
jgi:drug/metabolite transporter (DMT)-like permease